MGNCLRLHFYVQPPSKENATVVICETFAAFSLCNGSLHAIESVSDRLNYNQLAIFSLP